MEHEIRKNIDKHEHDEVIDIIDKEYPEWKNSREKVLNSEERLGANYKDWLNNRAHPKPILRSSHPDPNNLMSDYAKELLGHSFQALNSITNGLLTSISSKNKIDSHHIRPSGFSPSDIVRESAISREIRINNSLLNSMEKNISSQEPDKIRLSKDASRFAISTKNLREISAQENLRSETKAKILMHLGDSYKRARSLNKNSSKKLGASASESLNSLITAMKDMIDAIKSSASRKFSSPSP